MKKRTTEFQKRLARFLGMAIDEVSFAVAAAQIEEAVAPAIWPSPDSDRATPKQIEYASSFGLDVSEDSKRVASAKIQEEQDKRSKALIKEMKLQRGSVVLWEKHQRRMVVSSIAKNGRLWFKGGNGWGAFPHEIKLVESDAGGAAFATRP